MASEQQANSPKKRFRFRFTLKQLLLAQLVVALVLGIYVGWVRKIVTVRPARNDDPVDEHYLGISDENASIRNIVVMKGTFAKGTHLFVYLFAVQSGQHQEINSLGLGQTIGQSLGPIGSVMEMTLALGTFDTPQGRVTQLGSAGHRRGAGSGFALPTNITARYSHAFTGSITPGREYIIYAEGDTKMQIAPEMTLQEFAKQHAGNYLVVTAQLQ